MANIKISEMEEASQVISDDYIPIVQQGLNKKTKLEKMADFMATKIIESGSNANGDYIKYADGTMICRKEVNVIIPLASWTKWEILYEASLLLGEFPQEFIEIPDVHVANNSASGWWVEAHQLISKTSAGTLSINRPNAYDGLNVRAKILAIGKWK